MSKLLFNDGFMLVASVFTCLAAVILTLFAIDVKGSNGDKRTFLNLVAAALVSAAGFVFIMYFSSQIEYEVTYDGEWKQIYTNSDNLDISIDLNRGYSVKAGSDLGDNYSKLKFIAFVDGTITAVDDSGSKETRTFRLNEKDLIKNGELTSNSKIIKIEYRPVKGMHKTALGMSSKDETAPYEGEIKLTIDTQEKSDELKKLFD